MEKSSSKRSAAAPVGADDDEDVIVNESSSATIGDLVAQRLNRRDLMQGALASAVLTTALPAGFMAATPAEAKAAPGRFAFTEIEAGVDGKHHVAEGYNADVLIRGRSGHQECASLRPQGANRRQSIAAIWLQQRLSRVFSDRGFAAWTARRKPRIHQHGVAVSWTEKCCRRAWRPS